MKPAIVMGSFDNIRPRDIRFLQSAAAWGPLRVLLWSDAAIEMIRGQAPTCPESERQYLLDAIRYVEKVTVRDCVDSAHLLPCGFDTPGGAWVVEQDADDPQSATWCREHAMHYQVIPEHTLHDFPDPTPPPAVGMSQRSKVIVTGCYDWLHSGHVRFFEEVSQLGQLYVVVGHDANIRLLKGNRHPLFSEVERRYCAGSIKYVHQALISSGHGWLDAEPEIERIKPDIYAVNEDGDRPEKRAYCATHGMEYRVLKRTPKEGLPRRQSTDLRGF